MKLSNQLILTLVIGFMIGQSVWFSRSLTSVKNQMVSQNEALNIRNQDGKIVAVLGPDETGAGALVLQNAKGQRSAVIRSMENGSGGLLVCSDDGKAKLRLVVNPLGAGTLEILSSENEKLFILGTDAKGDPAFVQKN